MTVLSPILFVCYVFVGKVHAFETIRKRNFVEPDTFKCVPKCEVLFYVAVIGPQVPLARHGGTRVAMSGWKLIWSAGVMQQTHIHLSGLVG